jgi:cytochrome c peroxidase
MIAALSRVDGYVPYFEEAFGSPAITEARVAHAIADYERTRMSGNSPWAASRVPSIARNSDPDTLIPDP